jgi:hypothetical protein
MVLCGETGASRTREPEQREVGGVALVVTGPESARVADVIAALIGRLPDADRLSLGGLVLVDVDPASGDKRKALEGNWAFSTWVGGTHTILLRREISHLPDAALAFLVAHETAHIVHYGRGEIDHDEAEADRPVASWGGPTLNETWRSFRDNWVRVPVDERDGIPAWGEAMSEGGDLSRTQRAASTKAHVHLRRQRALDRGAAADPVLGLDPAECTLRQRTAPAVAGKSG